MERRQICRSYFEFCDLQSTVLRKIISQEIDVGPAITYATGLMLGSSVALCSGREEITAVEFGVSSGRCLLSLCKAAETLNELTGITYKIFGFDNCTGNPAPVDYRDHPEIWQEGYFRMPDKDALVAQLPPFAKLIEGPIEVTLPDFVQRELSASSPLGFVAVDVDLYSSTTAALRIFEDRIEKYLAAVPMYFDDVEGLLTYCSYCGEELAIREFNARNALRKIERKPTFGYHSYCCQMLDHPIRTGEEKPVYPFEIKMV